MKTKVIKNISKTTFIFFAVVFLFCGFSQIANAACTGSSPTWTCTPDYASVSSCVSKASVGDTINVSAGSVTWNSGLTITKGVKLIGAGASNTIITGGASGAFIEYTPANPSANSPFRVSGFTFNLNYIPELYGIMLWSGSTTTYQTKIRIDHNIFKNRYEADTQQTYLTHDGMRGVVDNNLFDTTWFPVRTLGPQGANEGGPYWNAWEGVKGAPPTGLVDNNFYFEDNIFNLECSNGCMVTDCMQGERYAFRYNTMNTNNTGGGQFFDLHGNGDGYHGSFGAELYGNRINGNGTFLQQRGGRVFMFMNSYTGAMTYEVREEHPDSDNPVTYIGPNPPQYPQYINGTYVWRNRQNYTGTLLDVYEMEHIGDIPLAGRDFFMDGTSPGIGCGTLANRPSTCAVGQGYWLTNQSCTDLTGMAGDHPANPISGTLYKCTATNVWTAYYTPLPYPHPLRNETPSTCVIKGDANSDGNINISDVQTCINVILGTDTTHQACSDMNTSGTVDITDCQAIINKILNP